MIDTKTCAVALLASIALGCQHAREPEGTTPAGDAPTGAQKTQIVANMKTIAFEAQSSRNITVTPGTTMTPVTDGGGTVRGIVVARDNTGITVNCDCPAGCSPGDGSDMSLGCSVGVGPTTATCSGNCSAPGKSCMGCSFSVAPVAPNSANAALIRDLNVHAQEVGPSAPTTPATKPSEVPTQPRTDDVH